MKLSLLAGLFIATHAFAGTTVHIVSPVGPSGAIGKAASIIHPKLEQLGWTVKFESLGNCAAANAVIGKSDSIVYYWSQELHTYEAGHPCYQPDLKENELVNSLYNGPYFLCSVGGKDITLLTKNDKVKLGSGLSGNPPEYLLRSISDKTQASVSIVNYQNTVAIEAGALSKEVDYVIASNGLSIEGKSGATCFWNTGGRVIGNTKPMMRGDSPVQIQTGVYLKSKGLPEDTMNMLRKDISSIIKSDEYQTFLKQRGAFDHANFDKIPLQVEFINKTGNGFKSPK